MSGPRVRPSARRVAPTFDDPEALGPSKPLSTPPQPTWRPHCLRCNKGFMAPPGFWLCGQCRSLANRIDRVPEHVLLY